MTFPRALLIIVVSAVPHVAPASAEPPLQDVGSLSSDFSAGGWQVIADRTRVAYMLEAGRVRVIDERLTEVATVVEHDCAWRSFGGGALLWARPTVASASGVAGEAGAFPIDQLDGGPRPVLGRPAVSLGGHGEAPSWWEVGRRWMTIYYDNSPDIHSYVNRVTGKVVYSNVESIDAARHVRLTTDLDQDDLTRRVCAPLAPRLVGEWPTRIAPLVYRAPYGATLIGTRLLMARCGARTLSVLSRCLRSCSAPVIGDRFVAWTEGTSLTHRTVYARLADRGRTWRWRVQAPPSRHPVAAVGRRLFIAGQGILQTVRLPEVVR
jgi:hypothetical protein